MATIAEREMKHNGWMTKRAPGAAGDVQEAIYYLRLALAHPTPAATLVALRIAAGRLGIATRKIERWNRAAIEGRN